MKKFGISMAVIFGFIAVFTLSGLIAFHSFPENDKKTDTEQAVGANMFSEEDPYANSNADDTGLLTIITPSIDKAKTTVRQGTVEDIVIYEKTTSIEEIDVGEVEEQKSILDEPQIKTETEKKPSSEKLKQEEKKSETEKKEEKKEEPEEATEEVKKEVAVEATEAVKAEEKKEDEKTEEPEQEEVKDEPLAEEAEKQVEEQVEEQPAPPEEEVNVPKAQSLPQSMQQEKAPVTLDPNKYYSDTGI